MLHRRSDIAVGDIAATGNRSLADRNDESDAERNEAPMAVGESPAVARHRLRRALREARDAKGLTQRQVSGALDWSMAKVNRIEAGDVTISLTDLQALLRLLEITDPERVQALTEQARAARQHGWWDQPEYRKHLTPAMIQQLQFEMEAHEIRSFQPTLIPGLLQTPAYAAGLMGLWSDALSEPDRKTRIEMRERRRRLVFSRERPPNFFLLLDESVLEREVGGAQVMSEQLHHLLELMQEGWLTVRVVPYTNSTPFAASGMFSIYSIDDTDVALYWENPRGAQPDGIIIDPVERHRRFFDLAWDRAFKEGVSARRIEANAARMRSAADERPSGG